MKINHKLLKLVEFGLKTKTLLNLTESQVAGLYNRLTESKKETKEATTTNLNAKETTYSSGEVGAMKTKGLGVNVKNGEVRPTGDGGLKVITKEGEMTEKAESKQQQKFMGLALSVKRGETPKGEVSKKVKETAKKMSEKELEDFASTKHKGLPKKVETKEAFGLGDYNKKLTSAVAGATKKNLGQVSPSVSIGESKEAIIERKIIQLVEKHLTPKMSKQDFLNLVKEQGTKEAPVKTPVKTPTKPKPFNPYQPKHKPAPKAEKNEVKEQGTKEAPVKTPVKTPTKPKPFNPYQPKHKPAPKAKNKQMPDWLSFEALGLNLK